MFTPLFIIGSTKLKIDKFVPNIRSHITDHEIIQNS